MSLLNTTSYYPVIVSMLEKEARGGRINDKEIEVLRVMLINNQHILSTRRIADECDMSIYTARNWLMRLEQKKLVTRIQNAHKTEWQYAGADENLLLAEH